MSAASVQSRISPPNPSLGANFSDAQVKTAGKAVDGGASADQKVDFRDLLSSSNAQAKADREVKKSGDLSTAKSEEEFFRRLEDKTKQTRTPKNALDKDDFLKLFVTQLQYQDPTQPKDSSEMAAQLAQFNGLEQMLNMNKGLEKLAKNQASSRSLDLVGYIGKEISIPKGKIKVEEAGKPAPAMFTNKLDVAEATLLVRDSSGVAIAEQPIGNFSPGEHRVEWNGKTKAGSPATPGVYSFEIVAKGGQGEQVPVDIVTKVKVTGIDLQDEGGAFMTDIGKIKSEEIRAVNLPQESLASPQSPALPEARKVTDGAPLQAAEKASAAAKDVSQQQPPVVPSPNTAESVKLGNQSLAMQAQPRQEPSKDPAPSEPAANRTQTSQQEPRIAQNDIFHPQVFPTVR